MAVRPVTPQQALVRMQALCSRAEHCSYEIRQKLSRMGLTASAASEVLRLLEEGRYVDDSRYARAFVRDKFMFARWGRRKIRLALAAKRIPSEIALEAIESIDPEEYRHTAVAVLRAVAVRYGGILDYGTKMKIFRGMMAKGYEPDVISCAFLSLDSDEADGLE